MISTKIKTLTLLALLLSVAGCLQAPLPEGIDPADYMQTPEERAEVLAALEAVEDNALREAFAQLDGYSYRRYVRTEQINDARQRVASSERILRYDSTGEVEVIPQDSAGAFEYGMFKRLVSENVTTLDPEDLTSFLLPKNPSYLDARNLDKYHYRFAGDTLLWDMAADIIEVRARPREGDGENIRRVRFYVDTATDELLAMHLERVDLALLFREESTFFVHIRSAPDGGWVPHNTRFQTRIRTPFQPSRAFRTVSSYSDYRPKSSS